MELLLFYINQIFVESHFPLPSEICPEAGTLADVCRISVSFTLIYAVAVLVFITGLFIVKKSSAKNLKLLAAGIISVLACFYLADHAMKQLQEPSKFGLEWFYALYNLWCLIITCLLMAAICFPTRAKKNILSAVIITVIATFLFAYTGRGNFEQITPLAGGLFAKRSWDFLWMSFNVRLVSGLLIICLLFGFTEIIYKWVIDNKIMLMPLRRNLLIACSFFLIILITLVSIPMGESLNRKDVKEAQDYIDNIKKAADKYYLENGEYPKFIEKMLPEGKSPKLLARHEYFTADIRGTYYFSRKEKYCFIFQNPTRKFGYYSLTSARDWRYNQMTGSYDDVFVNLCDETNESYENMISQHLGAEDKDKFVNEAVKASGVKIPDDGEASQRLNSKIMEAVKKNPDMFNDNVATGNENAVQANPAEEQDPAEWARKIIENVKKNNPNLFDQKNEQDKPQENAK